ncbi:MAG: NERD domain-containing protein [Metamycoplasma hominis]|uniref:NERD domain-containing protein n=1 Tax=Metamycoplasma hominis TaxID=2098 RepID=UPI00158F321C|nr:NERD domain-containing protein [Metamycoplasma hominis]MDU7418415.1 NERD domain-containing protein [Metamycoplasma hominis]QKX41404.1 NERD domain-containing protein [Metamycoplasma hominis]
MWILEIVISVLIWIVIIVGIAFAIHKKSSRHNYDKTINLIKRDSSKQQKGNDGEFLVARKLTSLNEGKYKVLNDILLQIDNDKTAQIDHIVVSTYGIFVIETKNWNGFITGGRDSYFWSKRNSGNNIEIMKNPIKQNERHIEALKQIFSKYNININKELFYSLIVFVQGQKPKIDDLNNCSVIPLNDLVKKIHSYNKEILEESQIKELIELIQQENVEDIQTRLEHNERAKKVLQVQQDKIKEHICPLCNGELTYKNGLHGKFYGCSNYPKCHFSIENID